MVDNPQNCLFPTPRLPGLAHPLESLGGYPTALVLGIVGSIAAALLICGHWAIAVAGTLAILALSLLENERFILIVIFLLPVGWILNADVPVKNVSVAIRILVIAGFFLGRLLRGQWNGRPFFRSSITRASILFLCVAVASNALGGEGWSHESSRSLYDLTSYIGFFLMLVVWVDSRQRIQKVLSMLLYSTIGTAVFAIFQEISGGYTSLWVRLSPSGEGFPPWNGRATSFLNYSNSLAGYLNLVLPFALACFVFGQSKWKIMGGWTLGLGFLALLSTQSVGGLGAFVSILILAILCFVRSRNKRLVLIAGICAAVALLFLARNIWSPAHTEEVLGPDLLTRLLLWGTAWDLFRHSPLIGVGWGNFIGLSGSYLSSFSAWMPQGVFAIHNIYLQLLAETGLVGFVTFFYLIVQSWRLARSQLRSSLNFINLAMAFGVLGALLSILVHGFVDFVFQVSPPFGTLFWVLLALLVANGRLESSRKELASQISPA